MTPGGSETAADAGTKGGEDQRLSQLEQLLEEMNERLKTIEGRLPPGKP
jgi:hypothetical protein